MTKLLTALQALIWVGVGFYFIGLRHDLANGLLMIGLGELNNIQLLLQERLSR